MQLLCFHGNTIKISQFECQIRRIIENKGTQLIRDIVETDLLLIVDFYKEFLVAHELKGGITRIKNLLNITEIAEHLTHYYLNR